MKKKFKPRFVKDQETTEATYKRLMSLSDTPDERDNDKGINGYIAFFALLFSSSLFIYFIYHLITM